MSPSEVSVAPLQTADPARRVGSLDLLRGVAVLLVLGRHYDVNKLWHQAGWIGVDLFFTLSGFLVGGLLLTEYKRTGAIDLKRFYIRRGFRIYPPFWGLMAALIAARFLGEKVSGKAILFEFAFVQNYLKGVWGHTWSLAVEEHFYILLPLVLIWVAGRSNRGPDPFARLPRMIVSICTAVLTSRVAQAVLIPFSFRTHVFLTHLRVDSMLWGVLLAYYFHFHRSRLSALAGTPRRRFLLMAICAAAIVPAGWIKVRNPYMSTLGFSVVSLGFIALLTSVLFGGVPIGTRIKRGLAPIARVMALIGLHSYSIYLWHIAVVIWLMPIAERALHHYPAFVMQLAYVACVLGVGILMSKLIETPSLKVRDFLFPRAGTPGAAMYRPKAAV